MICTPADVVSDFLFVIHKQSRNQDLTCLGEGGVGGWFYWDSLVQDGVFPLLLKKMVWVCAK